MGRPLPKGRKVTIYPQIAKSLEPFLRMRPTVNYKICSTNELLYVDGAGKRSRMRVAQRGQSTTCFFWRKKQVIVITCLVPQVPQQRVSAPPPPVSKDSPDAGPMAPMLSQMATIPSQLPMAPIPSQLPMVPTSSQLPMAPMPKQLPMAPMPSQMAPMPSNQVASASGSSVGSAEFLAAVAPGALNLISHNVIIKWFL